jgi:colanic acid biosynthesis glycosyl transferase WcaI
VTAILVFAINYAPEATGIAPYTTALAEHWAERHNVTVVTSFPHYPAWRSEAGRHWLGSTEERNGVRILRRRIYVPPRQTAARRAAYEATFLVNGLLARPGRPDAVIGVVPSLSGGVLARLGAARFHAPYGLILQDLMAHAAAQSGISGGVRAARITAAIETWAVARARTVAVVSEAFRPYLEARGVPAARVSLLRNWSHVRAPTADRTATRARLGWGPDKIIVLHAGNMGLKQDLDQVLDAAAAASGRSSPILFVLMGDGSQRSMLELRARGLAGISFLPFQPEDQLTDVLAAADFLLVSERRTVLDMSLPSKLTSYMAAGRPILAAVRPDGATAAEIRRAGAGVVVAAAEPHDLIEAVGDLAAKPDLMQEYGDAGRRYAATTLGSSTAFARADEFLGGLLASVASRRDLEEV